MKIEKEAPEIPGRDIPGLTLRVPDHSAFIGLQFGPAETNVVYLAFDCKEQYKPHDWMYIYSPGAEEFITPELKKGSKEKDGWTNFRKFEIETMFGDIHAEYDVLVSALSQWDKQKVRVDTVITCRLKRMSDGEKCRFILKGSFLLDIHLHKNMNVFAILDDPTLHVTWDRRSDPVALRCRIKLGAHQRLVPLSGLDERARVIVETEEGDKKLNKSIKIKPDDSGDFVYKSGRDFKPGRSYTANVIVDLEPFFGILKTYAEYVPRGR